MYKPALISGTVFAALAVVLGAFGAHALKAKLEPAQLQVFETGVRYQFYHSVALLLAGIIYSAYPVGNIRLSVVFFNIGVLLFSGSLYLLSFLSMGGKVGLGPIGILTPIGGLFFILGWAMLLMGIVRN